MSGLRLWTVVNVITGLVFLAGTGWAEQVAHTYDGRNRLIRTEYDNGSGIEYVYDAAGNRIGQKAIVPVPSITADLAIRMRAAGKVRAGKKIKYVVKVKNKSKIAVSGVVVTAQLPSGATLIKKPAYCMEDGDGLECSLGKLKRKASKKFKIVVKTAEAGSVTHTASVRGDAADPNPDDNTVERSTVVKEARGHRR